MSQKEFYENQIKEYQDIIADYERMLEESDQDKELILEEIKQTKEIINMCKGIMEKRGY